MEVGVEFGHYRVIEHIGRGGMADVWSARDKRLNRTVAIKTVARDLSQDMNPIRMFEREAQTIAGLEHPHILPIYEFGEYEGQLYIVMRYVSGGSLEDELEHGALSPFETMRIARAVAQALDYAHGSKIIHLDLKPSNILLDSYRQPYLADFGLATMLGPEGRAANPGSGTLLYMAPEQLTEDNLDHLADIYAFSILLFHMLTGSLPFDAAVPLALKQLQMGDNLPALDRIMPGLPPEITAILRKGTDKTPSGRPKSVGDIIAQLEEVLMMPVTMGASAGRTTSAPRRAAGTRIDDQDTATANLDDLITGSLDNLITKTAPIGDPAIDDALSRDLDGMITAPQDRISAENSPKTLNLDFDDLISKPPTAPPTPEEMAQREAEDIYKRAHRVWLHGNGRFLLGITHFMLINDYYVDAAANNLELDEGGMTMMLRGALEYDHDVAVWWERLDHDGRRLVLLHALRSESAPARQRALHRLETLPDGDDQGLIPLAVANVLQSEPNEHAQIAALQVLERRAFYNTVEIQASTATTGSLAALRHRLELGAPLAWRAVAYTNEIDRLLAEVALEADTEAVRERAARAIGRIRSTIAVNDLAQRQRNREHGALQALALVRDEAPSLPSSVSAQARAYAWIANTWRRLTENPITIATRFLYAALFGGFAIWWYAFTQLPAEAVFFAERWGRSLSVGALTGLSIGLLVVMAAELPERLRGFIPWWGRLIFGGALGFGFGALVWIMFTWFQLYFEPEQNMIYGGLGAAIAFALASTFRVPAFIAALWAALFIFLPLVYTWNNFSPPLLYIRPDTQTIEQFALPIALLIGVGAYFPALLRGTRALIARVRQNQTETA